MTAPLLGEVAETELHVMTFNVRRQLHAAALRRADRWSVRRGRVRAMLQTEHPAVLGVQEAMPDQAEEISGALGPRYRRIGRGRRDGGRGEACPVFFDADRLELLDEAQTALSDTPDVAGSMSWGNRLPRVMVTARFADRVTSAELLVINTHLDPFSRRSRERSVAAIRDRVVEAALPAVVLGDLNDAEGSSTLRALLRDGLLRDAWSHAARRETPEWGTFSNYRRPRLGAPRIDWIAVSPMIEIARAGIDSRMYGGGWPSDHLPVHAHIRVPGGAP